MTGRLATLTMLAALCVLGLVASAPLAHADDTAVAPAEQILLMDSDVHVLLDRTLRVQETIRIRSAGRVFKHGIEREFPQIYAGPYGSRIDVGFHIEEVLCDGAPERFGLRHRGRDAILRIGQRDVMLAPGEHTYRITYVTDRQLGFFADHDELYWNVTGDRSRLTIERATATITLPPAAQGQVRAATGYIGVAGSREQAKLASIEPTGGTFVAGRPLRPGEGLTVVLEWPKGIIPAPTQAMRFGWWLHDNRDAGIAILGIIVLAIFVSTTRARLRAGDGGADAADEPGTGAGTYEGLASVVSPCLLRYVVRGECDDQSLPIAILDMAERGCVTVRQTGAHYRVERTDKALDTLPAEEQSAAAALFGEKPQVELAPVDRKHLSAAWEALKFDLDRLAPRYVGDGRGRAFLGMLLSFVIVGVALGVGSGDPHIGIIVGLFFGSFVMAFFAIAGWLARTLTGRTLARTQASTVGIALVFAAGFAAAGVATAQALSGDLSPLAVGLCVGVLFMGYRAIRLWRQRTAAGEALYQNARRARQSAPPATSAGETGTGILPYVMALDAVAIWADGLEDLTCTPGAGVDRRNHRFYQDPNWLWGTGPMRLSSFTDDFSSMTAKAAGPAPGSSSGSSSGGSSSSSSSSSDSGGSSGGGGGGGGVGGW